MLGWRSVILNKPHASLCLLKVSFLLRPILQNPILHDPQKCQVSCSKRTPHFWREEWFISECNKILIWRVVHRKTIQSISSWRDPRRLPCKLQNQYLISHETKSYLNRKFKFNEFASHNWKRGRANINGHSVVNATASYRINLPYHMGLNHTWTNNGIEFLVSFVARLTKCMTFLS